MSAPYNDLPPYEAGSATSREAALRMARATPTMRERVYSFMLAQGSVGATDDEIEHALKMRHQTVSARRRELELDGRVAKTELRRRTSSGHSAAVSIALAPR